MLYPIKCVLKKRENLNFIVYNMITGRNKSKMLTRHISCKCKVNLTIENVTWIKSEIMINDGVSAKIQMKIMHVKKLYSEFYYMHLWKFWIFSKYYWLFNDYVAKIINAADSVSKNVKTDVTSTVSINIHNKKFRYKLDCYILQMVLVLVTFLFVIAFVCYHYTKHRSKQKRIGTLTI